MYLLIHEDCYIEQVKELPGWTNEGVQAGTLTVVRYSRDLDAFQFLHEGGTWHERFTPESR